MAGPEQLAESQAALFLDRDGVVIENRDHYVRSWDDVAFLPDALEALRELSRYPVRIVIVTNQSAVGRGLLPQATAEAINERVVAVIEEAGGRVDGAYICPHAPDDRCDCRKPAPGMLLQAARDLNIDLRRSIMVGDALTDIAAGQAAGVAETILVRTGRGRRQEQLPEAAAMPPFRVYESLAEVIAALPELRSVPQEES